MFKIEKNVPVPANYEHAVRGSKYPFQSMEVGDSAFFPEIHIVTVGASARKLKPKVFTHRSVIENGVKGTRSWRIK